MTPRLLRALVSAWAFALGDACSAYAAGRLATRDGSVMVSHSDDGAGQSDPRISYVPAADHAPGATRPIWPDLEDWPRFVGDVRGATYAALPGQKPTVPIGSIPQVAHTYGYYDANYAVQNECHLMFGESTASATFPAVALGQPGGTALFSVNELTRVASERVCRAREAIQLMGALAEQYGFYGADGGAGETLMIGDTEEVFVFHILSDPSGRGAIWAAQRVPDDHVAVIANMFSIREVDPDDAHSFLLSGSVHAVAQEYGLWQPTDGLLDFTGTYSAGEYGSKYYTGRRVWDGYRRMKPSLPLPSEYRSLKADRPYPFSVPLAPEERLDVHDWLAAHRSHYEGTAYDMTKGLAAGPFGSPDRFGTADPHGAWERSVSIYRTGVTWVAQARAALPGPHRGTVWWGPADSSKTVFVPLVVTMGAPPTPYTVGNPAVLDRASAFWAHRYIQNLVQLRYSSMIVDVQNVSAHWERRGARLLAAIHGGAEADPKGALDAHAAAVLADTWRLADALMVKFANGGLTTTAADGVSPAAVDLSYPSEWLAQVGYGDGEPFPPPGGWHGGAEPPPVGPDGPSTAARPTTTTLATSTRPTGMAAAAVSATASTEGESPHGVVGLMVATSAATALIILAAAAIVGVRLDRGRGGSAGGRLDQGAVWERAEMAVGGIGGGVQAGPQAERRISELADEDRAYVAFAAK